MACLFNHIFNFYFSPPHLNDAVSLPGSKFVCFVSGFVKVTLDSSSNSSCWLTTPIFMVCKQDLTWLIHFTLTYAKSKKNNTWKSSNILVISVLDRVVSHTLSLTWHSLIALLPMLSSPFQLWVLPCCNRNIIPHPLFVSLRLSLARRQCTFLGTTFWKGTNTRTYVFSLTVVPRTPPIIMDQCQLVNVFFIFTST